MKIYSCIVRVYQYVSLFTVLSNRITKKSALLCVVYDIFFLVYTPFSSKNRDMTIVEEEIAYYYYVAMVGGLSQMRCCIERILMG